ncbi:MAG: hypothetical protein FWE46_03095 [Coriobacteriia bacterium]|nr:hypothetical protein [Coriobacteriia bacterium]MCL2537321.1 hypothetical protein [Coriobacteriia bacterium]
MGVNEVVEADELGPRESAEKRFESSRNGLLAVLALTCVNIALVIANFDLFFLFSAYLPMDLLFMGAEFYGAHDFTFSTLGIIAAFAATSVYGIIWLATKKYRVWMIAALVYFLLDIALSVPWLIGQFAGEFDFTLVIELGFIAWILYYFVTGVIAWYQLKTMPEDDPTLAAQAEDSVSMWYVKDKH